jgi:glycosyltransferase involved in cell wall biosynthesis
MRLLQIHNHYRHRGGEDSVVEAEGEILKTAGHTVELYDVSNSGSAASSAGQLLASPWNPMSAARVKTAVQSFQPDLAHIHNTWFALSPSIVPAVASQGVPIVMTLHNYRMTCINAHLLRDGAPCELCVGNSPWQGVRFKCYRNSLPGSIAAALTNSVRQASRSWEAVSRFVALTAFARDIYIRAGLDPGRISIKPNFVPDLGPRPVLPSESEIVVYAGRISEEKGADVVAAAWERVAPEGLRLLMIGDGPIKEALSLRHPRVEFVGWLERSEVRRKMLEARALLFPSRAYEGQSMVILEAMASGLPIMASDWRPIRDTLQGQGQQWLREAANIESWVEGIGVIGENSQVDRAGSAVRLAYLSSFTPEIGLRNLEDIYASVTNG